MTEDEYFLAQCRQYGYDPNSKEEVALGKKAGLIFDCPEVKPAGGLYEPPETTNVARVHIAESKHNKASANYTLFANTNPACVLDIIDAIPDVIISHLFPDEEHASQASALKIL